jgi:hypothetical protein
MKRAVALALLVVLTACAGPGATRPGGGLAYRVPDQPTLTYLSADTTSVDIDAGAMGSFQMRGVAEATLAVAFAQGESGIQVTATVQKLAARMSQPMGGAQSASESDIQGNLVFTLDRKGRGTLVSSPQLKGVVSQLANPLTVAYEFFPRLPGGPVSAGATWTDTIQYEISTPEGTTTSSTVTTYILQGDTVVNGASLAKVTYQGKANVTGSAATEGMEVLQVFAGDVVGMFLWDATRAVFVAGEVKGDMTGTVEVPAAGMPPMPMTVSSHSVVRLQGS